MIRKIALLSTIALSTLAFSSITSASVMLLSSGPYGEFNIGYGKVRETVSGSTKEDTSGVALSINGGFKFNPTLAAEAGFIRFPNEDFHVAEGSSNYGVTAAVRGNLPFDNGFEAFGKVGLAYMSHELKGRNGYTVNDSGSHTAATFLLGAGLGYALSPELEGTLQALTTTSSGNVPGMHMITVGVSYLF